MGHGGYGKGRDDGKGQQEIPRNVLVSKAMVSVLRHTAVNLGLDVSPDGFVRLQHLLECKNVKELEVETEEAVKVVRNNAKRRMDMKEDSDGNQWVRAVQGHSMKVVQDEECMKPLSADDPGLPRECVHGTYNCHIAAIREKGLLVGGFGGTRCRNHVHFAPFAPGDGRIISGMRWDAEVAVWVDLRKALRAGVPFYMAMNQVIVSPGINGVVPAEFIEKVRDIETGEVLHGGSAAKGVDKKAPGTTSAAERSVNSGISAAKGADTMPARPSRTVPGWVLAGSSAAKGAEANSARSASAAPCEVLSGSSAGKGADGKPARSASAAPRGVLSSSYAAKGADAMTASSASAAPDEALSRSSAVHGAVVKPAGSASAPEHEAVPSKGSVAIHYQGTDRKIGGGAGAASVVEPVEPMGPVEIQILRKMAMDEVVRLLDAGCVVSVVAPSDLTLTGESMGTVSLVIGSEVQLRRKSGNWLCGCSAKDPTGTEGWCAKDQVCIWDVQKPFTPQAEWPNYSSFLALKQGDLVMVQKRYYGEWEGSAFGSLWGTAPEGSGVFCLSHVVPHVLLSREPDRG